MQNNEVKIRMEDAVTISEIMEGIGQPTSPNVVIAIMRENYPHKTPENIARSRKVMMLNERIRRIRMENEDNLLSEIEKFKVRCICEGVPDMETEGSAKP